jgi:hypothetical protein
VKLTKFTPSYVAANEAGEHVQNKAVGIPVGIELEFHPAGS